MSADSLMLLSASGLLLVAHILRATRWALLFPAGYLKGRFDLLLGLGVGYALNAFLPMRPGELARAALASRREGVRFSYVAATVLVERATDLAVVVVLFATMRVLEGAGSRTSWGFPISMASALAAIIAATLMIRRSLAVRTMIWRAASLFNDVVRIGIVDFCWSCSEIAVSGAVLRWRYLAVSVVMWSTYFLSYEVFARAIGVPAAEVLRSMLGSPLASLTLNTSSNPEGIPYRELLLEFAVVPILVILVYGVARDSEILGRLFDVLRRHGKSGVQAPVAIRNRFKIVTTYEQFLAKLFGGGSEGLTGFEQEAIGDSIIHKFFDGGSDAVTALVEVDSTLRIRKFAVSGAAEKLKTQADWLCGQASGGLPLVQVIKREERDGLFSYDMPMVTPINDLYDVIHTSPLLHSKALLSSMMDSIHRFHGLEKRGDAATAIIDSYLDIKACRNAELIEVFARRSIHGETFEINRRSYGFSQWHRLNDRNWLRSQIRDRRTAVIHGDLTIENVVVAPGSPSGFYIIDPNPDNLFDTPLIDWAKLMQSLHLGYETLNRGMSCQVTDRGIYLTSLRSDVYAELHAVLEAEIVARLGPDALREIYFHEIINYLRLTTYKIRQSSIRGLGFFACTNILLDRYMERWG